MHAMQESTRPAVELAGRIARALPDDGTLEPQPGVHFRRPSRPTATLHSFAEPAFCVIAQGRKEIVLGGRSFRYDAARYLITTVELPLAFRKLREQFDQPPRIASVARELAMSVSGFHAHFKAVTALSPLQFQKRLRLQEARRLMLSEDLDAAQAGYRVGYEDPSHFSRDDKRHFGEPPARDVGRARSAS